MALSTGRHLIHGSETGIQRWFIHHPSAYYLDTHACTESLNGRPTDTHPKPNRTPGSPGATGDDTSKYRSSRDGNYHRLRLTDNTSTEPANRATAYDSCPWHCRGTAQTAFSHHRQSFLKPTGSLRKYMVIAYTDKPPASIHYSRERA